MFIAKVDERQGVSRVAKGKCCECRRPVPRMDKSRFGKILPTKCDRCAAHEWARIWSISKVKAKD